MLVRVSRAIVGIYSVYNNNNIGICKHDYYGWLGRRVVWPLLGVEAGESMRLVAIN